MLVTDCLQQPLFIFGLTLLVSLYWFSAELSLFIAVSTALLVLMISTHTQKEHYCSEYRNRWCPEKDFCLPDENKERKVEVFLDETDNFIKEMYDFVRPDDPAYVVDMGTPKIEGTPYKPVSKSPKSSSSTSGFLTFIKSKYWIGILSCCCIIIAIFIYLSMRRSGSGSGSD